MVVHGEKAEGKYLASWYWPSQPRGRLTGVRRKDGLLLDGLAEVGMHGEFLFVRADDELEGLRQDDPGDRRC